MITIGNVLQRSLKKLPNGRRITGQMLIDAWPAVTGEHIAAKTRAVSFENGVLLVRVKDSVWAQHLSLQKKQIMGRLNRETHTKILTDIRYQVGETLGPLEKDTRIEEKENWRHRMLDDKRLHHIDCAVDDALLPLDLALQIKQLLIAQEKRISWYQDQGYPACRVCKMPVVTTGGEDICICCKNGENG